MQDRVIQVVGYGLVGLVSAVFFVAVLPSLRVFPYADEWHYVRPLTMGSPAEIIAWIFTQHGDHRIPLQKMIHGVILMSSGFDFRATVAFNYVVACVVSVLSMEVARIYRGRRSIGDLFIPACALSLGAGFSQWGFHLQFLSSTFFLVAFLYLFVSSERLSLPARQDLAVWSLAACAMCGMNGLVTSTVVIAILVTFYAWEIIRSKGLRRRGALYIALAACSALNVFLWATWTPAGASSLAPSLEKSASFFIGLVNSSLVVYAFDHAALKAGLLIALVAAALWAAFWKMRKGTLEACDVALFSVLTATLVLMLALAVGRSTYQGGWSPGLEMHYGYLTIMMPMVAWMMLPVGARSSMVIGVALVAVFGKAYLENAHWRFGYIANSTLSTYAAQLEVADSSIEAGIVASRNMSQFFWMDSNQTREYVITGIQLLRVHGGYLYRKG